MKASLFLNAKTAGALCGALMFAACGQAQTNTNSTALPFITVIAPDDKALEGTSTGSFTLLRFGPTNADVTVNLGISGTASNGVDYATIAGTVTIPAGNLAVDIPVTPIVDTNDRGNKTVILTVETNADYVASHRRAKVEIIDDIFNIPKPTVTITSPDDGSTFTNPVTITITATAEDSDLPITHVSFYANDDFLASVSNAPYTFNWVSPRPGHYAIFARAVDTADQSTLSEPVHITVTRLEPTVTITSPTNGSRFAFGTSIPLAANASEPGGSIASVQFSSGGHTIGTVTNTPYDVTWSNAAVGIHLINAVATDAAGNKAVAFPVLISVTNTNVTPVAISGRR